MRIVYLKELFAITKIQQDALLNDDYEQFIALLEERQVLIEKVEEMSKLQPLNEEEKSILFQIKDLDAKNAEEYSRQLEETKKELKKINDLKRQNVQYTNPYDLLGKGIYFDRN